MENGESRNMAREHNTQQIIMFKIAIFFWRTKLLSPEKQPESVPESKKVPLYDLKWFIDKGVADMRQKGHTTH